MTTPAFHRCLTHHHHDWDDFESTCYSLWHARNRLGMANPVTYATADAVCPCRCWLPVTAACFRAWTGRDPVKTPRYPTRVRTP